MDPVATDDVGRPGRSRSPRDRPPLRLVDRCTTVAHIFTVSASPGMHRRREAALHAGETRRIAVAQRVQQCPPGEAVGAEPVQDRPVEAAHRRERRDPSAAGCGRPTGDRSAPGRRGCGRSPGDRASRSGGTLRGPDGPRSPPHPPSPRMNADIVVLNNGLPVATFVETSTRSRPPRPCPCPRSPVISPTVLTVPRRRDLVVQLDRLLAVHEHRRVERPDRRHGAERAGAEHHGHRRQHAQRRVLACSRS